MFTMIMQVEIDGCSVPFRNLPKTSSEFGKEIGMTVHAMHEDIFNSMHRI